MTNTTVLPDRITFGPDFVPRFLDLPNVLVVAEGSTFELPQDSTYDYIEVAGTLRVSRTRNTTVRFIHLFILPTGHLDCGIEDSGDPIPAHVKVEFIIQNVPIDTARDPYQWGNAILNFGRQDRCGAAKLAWCPLVVELLAGATTITLSAEPVGWEVGDELFIPDTDQPSLTKPIRRETPVFVAGMSGRTVTLSKPLDFDHRAQREPDGTIVLQPRVANLTRNITVRSEDPAGTPGHTANIGMGAMWCICWNQNLGLGRTRAVPLDNYNPATGHIGTNQIARYSEHYHHAMGFGSSSIGNVGRGVGTAGTKWGFSIHDTSDAIIEDNICIDFAGAGIVTEDGPEVRNIFRRNFTAYILGTNVGEVNIAQLVSEKNPGSEGAGFWWRGLQNTFEGNESWNCAFGIVLVQSGAVSTVAYPSQPGGENDTFLNIVTAIPILFTDNVTASHTRTGLEYWSVPRFPAKNHTSSYNTQLAFQMGQSDPAQIWLVNPSFVGKFSGVAEGLGNGMHANMAYTDTFEISGGGRVLGFLNGLMGAGGVTFTKLVGTPDHPLRMQNVLDVDMEAINRYSIEDNVMHVKLPGFPEQFTRFSPAEVWNGQPPLPRTGATYFATQRGSQHYIKNYQGTGKDYRLIAKQALGSFAALYSQKLRAGDPDYDAFSVPEQGLTNAQAWAKYGMAYSGEEIDTADVVPLVGLVNGFARVEGPTKFGPPRAIMTFPNAWSTPPIEGDATDHFVQGYGVMTGDPTGTSDLFLFSLDGGQWVSLQQSEFSKPGARAFGLRNLTEGLHEVRTRRADLAGVAIPSSEMVFPYSVGPVITPPPVVPPVIVPPVTLPVIPPIIVPPTPDNPPLPVETWAPVQFGIERLGTSNRYRVTLGGAVLFEFSRP